MKTYLSLFLAAALCLPAANAKNLNKKLLDAILEGDVSRVEALIEKGADVNFTISGKESMLMCAAERGNPQIAKLLIDHGADVNHRGKKGETALSKAVAFGRLQVAQHPFEHGFKVDAPPSKSTSPLLMALQRRDFSMTRLLLEKGADVNQQNDDGQSALHLASGFPVPTFVEYLLMSAANVNLTDKNGNTPLALAVIENNIPICKRLLQYGADPNAANHDDITPRQLVPEWNEALAKILDEPGKIQVEAIRPQPKIDGPMIQKLLESGRDINQEGPKGSTAIFHTIEAGNLEALSMLIDHGADIDHANEEGTTPLMVAAFHGRAAMVDLLLEKGADPNALSKNGFGALYIAGARRDRHIAKSLMTNGGNRVAKLFGEDIELPKNKFAFRRLKQQIGWLPNLTQASYTLNHGEVNSEVPKQPETLKIDHPNLTPPKFTKKVRPEYPIGGLAADVSGHVLLEAVLCKDGKIRDIQVLKAMEKGRLGFEVSAINSLRQWEFIPGTLDGKPRDVRMTLRIDFQLRRQSNPF